MANPNLALQLLITAKDEASSALGKIGNAMSSLGGLIAGATKAALELVFPDLGDSVKAAENLEIQMGKLRAGIIATGGAAGLTAEDIDAMARRLDEATLGSAEGFRNAAIELLTFKSVGVDSFERTLKAAQDLADAGFGTVESATVQLGKALEDPIKGMSALTRVGVTFNAEQTTMIDNFIRLGETAQAQNVILAAVEGQVQGIASAAGGGLAGAVDLVGKRMTDLKETVGGTLTPVLAQLNLIWADVIGSVQKAATEIAGPLVEGATAGAGAMKALGEGIGQFLGDTIRDLGTWIQNLDWQTIQDGASQAKAKLDEVATSFKEFGSVSGKVVDGITLGVNAAQVAFNGIVGGVQTLVSNFLSGLASVEETASKVGLGSLERAAELRARAEEWKGYAAESIAAVKRDAADAVTAFDSLTDATDAETAAQLRLKTALPTAELLTLNKTLDDYRGMADRANAASQQAARDHEAGKISAAEYGQKLLDAADANRELADATESAKGKTGDYAEQLKKGILQFEGVVDQSKKYTDAVEGVVKAETAGIQAAIALAKAKGDTAAVQRLTIELAQKEADGAVRIAKAKQVEQQAESAVAQKKLELAQIAREKNQITAEELTLAELVAQKELAEAEAAGVNTQAMIQLAAALREVNATKVGATGATQESTAATGQNTQSTEQAAEKAKQLAAANRDSTDILKKLVDMLNSARSEMKALSDNTEIYFDLMLANTLSMQGFAGAYEQTRLQQVRFNAAISDADPELSKLREGLAKAETDIRDMGLAMITSANSFAAYEIAILKAKATTTAAFNEQAIRATELTRRYEEFAKGGAQAVGGITVTMSELNSATGEASSSMNLLDKQRLDTLKNAIEAANDKLRDMQQEAQDAAFELAELNAEILAESGNTAAADALKLQVAESQKLADLEQRRRDAEMSGNKQLVSELDALIAATKRLYDLKGENLKAEQAGADKTTKTNKAAIAQAGELATNLERSASAAKTLNSVPLDGLLGNLNQVGESVNRLRSAL